MACTAEEFRDLLGGDDADIDIVKVRDSARRGVPPDVRAEVWKYLLLGPDHGDGIDGAIGGSGGDDELMSSGSSHTSSRASPISDEHDLEVVKKVRGEIHRYERKARAHLTPEGFIVLENVLRRYMDRNRNLAYSPVLIHLCGPLVSVLRNEHDVFTAFEAMMSHIDEYSQRQPMHERVTHFMSLFRRADPELYEYFEGEEVLSGHWAFSWMECMLAREMSMPNVLRLWDCYFSDGWALHPFICLAVLRHWRDTLEELENSEIVSFLGRLPPMDIDEIYHEAVNLSHELDLCL